jgi:hypothetical protein
VEKSTAEAKLAAAAGDDRLKLRQYASRRRSQMIAKRANWIPDWQQVCDYIDPSRGQFGTRAAAGTEKPKSKRTKIIDSTATVCVRTAAAGLSSHMTSKSRPWFKLTTPSPEVGKIHAVKVWLDDVTRIVTDTLARSNFYKAMPSLYTDDLCFGLAAMMILPNDDEVVTFHPLEPGTFAIALNDAGKVDSLWRTYTKTARQLVEKYGVDGPGGEKIADGSKLPDAVQKAYKQNPDQEFNVESLFEPNPDARSGMGPLRVQAVQHRPWREVVWIEGTAADRHGIMEVGGHYEAPFVCIRFNPVGDAVYSTAPAIDALGDIKSLQYWQGQKMRLLDLLAEPPLSIPDSMRNLGASVAPRARNYLPQSQVGTEIAATYSPDPRALMAAKEECEEIRDRLRQAFFFNLFLMLESLGDQTGRTATEIAERKDEKASVLGPTLEIVTDEGLDPTVVRVYRLLERAGRIPPAPEALANEPVRIEYTSILAQAMKAAGLSSIERTAAFVTNMAAAYPEALDNFDPDAAVEDYAERAGAPARMLRGEEQRTEIRQGRAQQQQQQMALAAAKPVADAAQAVQTLNEAVPVPGSMGDQLAQQMAGGAAV